MKNNSTFETLIGALVVAICILFIMLSAKLSGSRQQLSSGYKILAEFDNVDGLNIGSDIKVAGVKVGSISDIELNKENYRAKLTLKVINSLKVPTDSIFKVSTSGLIGNKFINIKIGADEEYFKDGEYAEFTESSMDLEDLISRFVFNSGNKDENKN